MNNESNAAKRTRVMWTQAEKDAVSRQSFEFRRIDVLASDAACVERAQQLIFSPERQRRILKNSLASFGFILVDWANFMVLLRDGKELPPLPAPYKPGPSPVDTDPMATDDDEDIVGYAEQRIQPLVHPEVEREYNEQAVAGSNLVVGLAGTSTQDLIIELMSRMSVMLDPENLKKQMTEIANQVVESRVPSMVLLPRETEFTEVVDVPTTKHNPEQKAAPKVQRFKVLVIGLSSGQEKMMAREYPEIDFYFLSGAEGFKRLENTHKIMDLTIKTQWVKGTMGSTSGWKNYVHVSGLDGIRKQMKDRFQMTAESK